MTSCVSSPRTRVRCRRLENVLPAFTRTHGLRVDVHASHFQVRTTVRITSERSRNSPSIARGHTLCSSTMNAMSLSGKQQAAARHRPIAVARESEPRIANEESLHLSETRLQVGVARQSVPDDGDPYADVPCT